MSAEFKTLNSELKTLSARYPHTVAAFTAMGALDHLEKIAPLRDVVAFRFS